jgi:hypothetical protein
VYKRGLIVPSGATRFIALYSLCILNKLLSGDFNLFFISYDVIVLRVSADLLQISILSSLTIHAY